MSLTALAMKRLRAPEVPLALRKSSFAVAPPMERMVFSLRFFFFCR
jgi:hypothetical protein